MPPKRKAWLQKRVKLNGKWCSRPAEQVKDVTGIYVLAYWQDGLLVRRPVGTDFRKAESARNHQNLVLNAKAAGLVQEDPQEKRHLLSAVVQDYLAHLKRKDLTAKSITGIENILALFKQKYLEDITLLDVAGKFVDKLRQQDLAKQTVYDRFAKVVSFLKWCERTYGFKRVVTLADGPAKPSHGSSDAEKEPYTQEQLAALNKVSTEEERLYWLFLLHTGCREREMTTCRWEDLDLTARKLHVRQKPGFTPKNKTARTVPFSGELANALRVYKAKSKGSLVFAKNGGEQRHIIRILKKRASDAGMNSEEFFLHRFRHSFANRCLRAGVDIMTVSSWLGHSDLATTRLYLKKIKDESKETQAMVDRVWQRS